MFLFSTRRKITRTRNTIPALFLKHRLILWNKNLQKSFFIRNLLKNIDIQNTVFLCVQNVTFFFFKSVTTVKESAATSSKTRCSQTTTRTLLAVQRLDAWLQLLPSWFAGLDQLTCAHTYIFLELIPCLLTNKLPSVEMAPVFFFTINRCAKPKHFRI